MASLATVTLLVACSGPAAPTPGQPTQVAPATGGQPAPPAGGGQAVTVVLTGGDDAGTYTGSENPNCSVGLVGEGVWGVQYSIAEAGADQLSSLQLVSGPDDDDDDDDGMFADTSFLMTVTIGPLFGEGSRTYEVKVRDDDDDDDDDDDESSGSGSAQVSDSGSTAVIQATGTTEDGVQIAATVNCPTVIRQ